MRRSMLSLTATTLVALGLVACADKDLPTSLRTTGPSSAISQPPVTPTPIGNIPLPIHWKPLDLYAITAGDNHTCVRTYNGRVFCWGRDDNGQAGTSSSVTCGTTQCIKRPTRVMVQHPNSVDTLVATALDAGDSHTCVIDPNSDAYCWGDGNDGQVGFGAGLFGPVFIPTIVTGNLKFNTIGAGSRSTCGGGPYGVYCWGVIANQTASPKWVSSYAGVVQIAVGNQHACYLDNTGSGKSYCWGNNSAGQITLPVANPTFANFSVQSTFGLANDVATQSNYTCADLPNYTVQCAGDNTFGQLGNGTSGAAGTTGTPQLVGGGTVLHGVSTGITHACALDAHGYAYCWGNGFNGELGNNVSGVFTTPQAVTGGLTYRAIAAGAQHTCAIGTNNHIYCWGQNGFGQLGNQYPGGWVLNPTQALDP